MKRIFALIILGLCFTVSSFSQYYSTGQDPAHLKWKQINTNDFRIVFPSEYEAKARYLATLFQDLKGKGGKDLNRIPKKFSVILHTQTATSNGLVAWAPKRMELYTTPPQDDDTQAWLDHLATHEYRHIVQMDKLEQGFTRALNFIMGQQATALVVGLYVPSWFMEGDAVCTETAMSKSGRGRRASFEQELKAQLLEKGSYSYDKAVLGSYKDFVPNRYTLGYYLVGKSRVNYGDQFWDNTLNKVGSSPFNINCFSSGLKNGMSDKRSVFYRKMKKKQDDLLQCKLTIDPINWDEVEMLNTHRDGKLMLYADVTSELKWEWQNQDLALNKTPAESLINEQDIFTNYRYPHIGDNNKILLMKSGLADAMSFISIDSVGEEKMVYVPGFDYRTGFDVNDETLLWAEQKAHLRWQHADKAIIVSYDLRSKIKRKYKLNNNCFAPVFSSDGKRILSVELNSKGESSLLIIDTKSASILKRIRAEDNEFFMTPQWAKNDESLVLIIQSNGSKRLVEIDLTTEKKQILYNAGKTNISQAKVDTDYVFFTSSYTGIDNVFAYKWQNGNVYQLTSSRFGAKDSYYHQIKNKLYYSDYSSNGYKPVSVNLDSCLWEKQEGEQKVFALAENLSSQLGERLSPDTVRFNQWDVKAYSRLNHMFKFHSWAPLFVAPNDAQFDIGISASSQNLLNTLFTTVGYRKKKGFDQGLFYLNLSYQRFFPIFNSKIEYGKRSLLHRQDFQHPENKTVINLPLNTEWKELEWENSITFPFNLSSGKHMTFLKPKFSYNIYKRTNYKSRVLDNENGFTDIVKKRENININKIEYQLYFSHSIKSSQRDLQSPWAQFLRFDVRSSPSKESKAGRIWSGIGQFYFPGFAKHHSLSVYAGFQHRSKLNTIFGNSVKSPRGISNLVGLDCSTMSLDYRMPIAYPDWSVGKLAYIKRVKMNTFVDYGIEKGEVGIAENLIQFDNRITSVGLEFTADMHVLRLPIPLNLGFRLGYEDKTNAIFGNLLLSYSLSF